MDDKIPDLAWMDNDDYLRVHNALIESGVRLQDGEFLNKPGTMIVHLPRIDGEALWLLRNLIKNLTNLKVEQERIKKHEVLVVYFHEKFDRRNSGQITSIL